MVTITPKVINATVVACKFIHAIDINYNIVECTARADSPDHYTILSDLTMTHYNDYEKIIYQSKTCVITHCTNADDGRYVYVYNEVEDFSFAKLPKSVKEYVKTFKSLGEF